MASFCAASAVADDVDATLVKADIELFERLPQCRQEALEVLRVPHAPDFLAKPAEDQGPACLRFALLEQTRGR